VSASGEPARLDVAAALEHGALRSTATLHRTAENPTIDTVALVTRPEQARRVPPRAAVVIAAGAESSGWLVSSVIRYAWERRASVVVAAGVQPDSVLVLAQRLDITLLSTDGDPARLALELSADIGAANAAVEAQLVAVLRIVNRESTVDAVLRALSAELGGLPLEVAYRGAVVASAGTDDRAGRQPIGPLRLSGTGDLDVTLTAYTPRGPRPAGFAEAALQLALPTLRAVWLDAEAADRLDGLAAAAAATTGDPSGSGATWITPLGWTSGSAHLVVVLRTSRRERSRALTNVVRLLWRRAMGRGALGETLDGWAIVLPVEGEHETDAVVRRARSKLAPGLAGLGIQVGVSSVSAEPNQLGRLLEEARLAARCAWTRSSDAVAAFPDLELSAIDALFDPDDARTIARLVLPEFCAAADLDRLVESVSAVLREGSVSAAAIALDVHRNTLAARLERARNLGLPVGEPRSAFAVAAIVRALQAETKGGFE
jgi:hypothetical protein